MDGPLSYWLDLTVLNKLFSNKTKIIVFLLMFQTVSRKKTSYRLLNAADGSC